jgi:hypothetical protein
MRDIEVYPGLVKGQSLKHINESNGQKETGENNKECLISH